MTTLKALHRDGRVVTRREFGQGAAVLLLGGILPLAPRPHGLTPATGVQADRVNQILADLRQYGGTEDGGTTRLAYSDEDLAARSYVTERMRQAGLDVTIDLAGNLVGRREGERAGLAPIVIGSHIDTVPGGGSYDGQVGAAGALEVALALNDRSHRLNHPLEVIVFPNEEGGKTGSRALVGRVLPFELDIVTAAGFSIRDGTRRLGGDPERLSDVVRPPGSLHAFLELHVEQGAVLEREGTQIGIVEGIVGIRRWNVRVEGATNHAGTTPMDQRRDALVAASDLIVAVEHAARSHPGRQVATVGRVTAFPGAPNVIPGRVDATLEIRDLSMDGIDALFETITAAASEIEARRAVTFGFMPFYESLAAPTDARIQDQIERTAQDLGYSSTRLPSGAGHDAQSMAEIGPIGMVFVPSRGGISHSPDEWTAPEDVSRGARVLFQTILALDQQAL